MNIVNYIKNTNLIISKYILPLGFLFFLTGILYFSSFSAYHTQIYLFLIAPTLILTLINPQQFVPIFSSNAFRILLLLFIYASLSLLWNTPNIDDFKYFKRFFIILLFIFSLLAISKESPDKVINILLLAACIYAIAACYSFYIDFIVQNKTISERIFGIGNLHNPLLSSHIYGVFTAFIMTYFFAIKRNWKKDIVLALLFLTLLSFVLLTQSRTPLLGLGVSLLLLLWMHRSKHLLYFFLTLCGFLAIYFSINFDLLIERGLSFRPEIWSLTIEQTAKNPFFGSGIGTKILIYVDDLKKMFSDTHNIHLGLTYHLGLLGLFIWISLLILLFLSYLKNKTSLLAQSGIVLLTYGMTAGITEGTSFLTRPKEIWFLTWLPITLLFISEYKHLTTPNSNPHETTS